MFQSSVLRLTIMGIALCSSSWLTGDEVLIRTPAGENLVIDVHPCETFTEVMSRINASIDNDSNSSFVIDFMSPEFQNIRAGAPFSDDARVYNGPITEDQKDDLRYILKSMATKSWTELLKSKNSMNRAGDNLDNIHPLNFLACIFKSEELKGCLHSIRDRKKIWDNFFEGLEKSLQEESQRNNMKPEFIQDFANTLGVKVADVRDQINNRNWDDLVEKLLDLLPRQGNPGRYDM